MRANGTKRLHRLLQTCALVLGATGVADSAYGQSTLRASVDTGGRDANGQSLVTSISPSGRWIGFWSFASDIVAGDKNSRPDCFLYDRVNHTTICLSVTPSGALGNGYSAEPSMSSDGQRVVFASEATNLAGSDNNGVFDVYFRDIALNLNERISIGVNGDEPDALCGLDGGQSISDDGNVIVYISPATNLVLGDGNGTWDVFRFNRMTRTTTRVSVDSAGIEGNNESRFAAISADGDVIAFESYATNLVPGDKNGSWDIFVHTFATGVTERVSVDSAGVEGNGESFDVSMSSDGRFVTFRSESTNLVSGDLNNTPDYFLRDRLLQTTSRINLNAAGQEANQSSWSGAISGDGSVFAFASAADNLVAGDANGDWDIFVRDLITGAIERATVDSTGADSNGSSLIPVLFYDGMFVAFQSGATNLIPADGNGTDDVFVRDRCPDADWSNYGAGFPGTLGIPSLVARADPVIGTTLEVDIGNSATTSTLAAIILGEQRAVIPLRKGGDLLLVPLLVQMIALPTAGLTISEPLDDNSLCGAELLAQTLIVDPGAALGQAASAGLSLRFGR